MTVRRVMSVLMKIVGGFVAVVLVIYVAVNLASMARGWHQRGELSDAFAERAEPLLPALREHQVAMVREVGRPPDRSRIEQVCAFDHDDSGWMINNFRERCSMRAVSAWRVESPDDGRRLLEVVPPEYPVADPTCEALGTPVRATELTVGEEGHVDVFLALAGRDPDRECGDLTLYGNETRTVEGDAEPLSADSTWVVVVADSGDLIDEDIGCAAWSVLFCDNPFTDHAWADLG